MPLAHVVGRQECVSLVIADGHALTANAANRQALQQGGTFSRWALLALLPERMRVLAQTQLVLFELMPGDIAVVRIANERYPLLGRKSLVATMSTVGKFALPRAPIAERTGIARVMQDPERTRMLELVPGHITFVWSAINASRELEALLTERPDRCNR